MVKENTTPLDQVSRMLDLVPFLLTHQGIALSELAKHFNVSEEIVLDDLNTLWMCGLPGYTPLELIDLSFESGFVTIRNANTLAKVRKLNSSEIISLTLGLDLLKDSQMTLDTSIAARVESLSDRLREIIGASFFIEEDGYAALRGKIHHSITHGLDLTFDYFSLTKDSRSQRHVTPYGFYIEDNFEYLEAYCHSGQADRVFRFDRISEAVVGDQSTVTAPVKSQRPADRVRAAIQINRASRRNAERLGISLIAVSAGSEIVIESFTPEWILRSILAGAGDLSLTQPAGLIAAVSQSARLALALYE
jgi:proteasome accessory factor C